jgi:serine/threonine protein kinase
MALTSGTRLGPHEILSAIGAGGMGEVYRARDTRLDRIVAIKVLPTHLAGRSELRERFEREARTIAGLNHPHICTLHDIGQQDGVDYLVMEYLEGETLAHRLNKGFLSLEQVFQYAIEIADALDKAHRKGVTHRDLKPGNIMLTKTGTKLLDFGLAKLKQEVAPTNVALSDLPTAKDPLTAEGAIVGTLQYMAPEQLEGKEVDARTDIFAFGAVVYEMATGKRAFEGKSQASLIAAILEREPPAMSSLQPMTPPALDRVVKKCLTKEPDRRWQAASDLCDELKWISEGGSQVASAPSAPRPVSRLSVALPPGQQLTGLVNGPAVALSPDGTHLAYVARQGGTQQIYLRAMDNLEARPISGTEGAVNPFFSPDGQWLGFFWATNAKMVYVCG